MTTRLVSMAFLSLMVTAVLVSAQVPPGPLSHLVDTADVIVLGRITDVTDLGLAPLDETSGTLGRLISGQVEIQQVLKGPANLRSLVFQSPVSATALMPGKVAQGTYGILLLKQEGDDIRFVSPDYLPVLGTVVGPRIEASDPLEAVVKAITAVLATPEAPTSMKRVAIHHVWNLRIPAAVAGLRAALEDKDRSVQLAAVGALLSNNDVGALSLAEPVLLQPDIAESPEVANLRLGLQLGLRGLRDPAAVPTLIRLLTRGEVATRRAVTVALGQIGSQAALQALGRAIDDEDVEVRINALWAIADATGQKSLRPSWDAFRQDEAHVKSEWKARLATLGVELP